MPLLVLLIGVAIVLPWGPWWVRWGIVGVVVAVIAACMIILPPIRYRVFWYAISSTEIDVQDGIIFIKRSVVPMHRVQTLRSERGPIGRPLPDDEPEDPYCGRLGEPERTGPGRG